MTQVRPSDAADDVALCLNLAFLPPPPAPPPAARFPPLPTMATLTYTHTATQPVQTVLAVAAASNYRYHHQPASAALLRLPAELVDEILADLEHADLVALALVSKAGAALVIPRHTEYRVIRTRHLLPAMWAHLARRADLARNIREVHIAERSNRKTSDRIPRTLLLAEGSRGGREVLEETRVRNMCEALGHMQRLRTFTWSWEVSPPTAPMVEPGMENAVLSVLGRKSTLRHLGLAGLFAIHAPGRVADPESLGYPLWAFSGLTSLSLRGDAWIKSANAVHVRKVLSQSTELEYLELPLELAPTLADLKFPALTRVNLFLNSGGVPRTLDASAVRFLASHPDLTHLSWTPCGQVYLSPNALPSLRALQTSLSVVEMLDCKHLESLDVYGLTPDTLISLAENGFSGASLKRVRLEEFGDMDALRRVAELFPNLTWLALPSRYSGFTLDDWLDLLPRFRHLEVFRGQALWAAVTLDMTRMHGAIMRLVQMCPRLRELDHCGHNEARQEWNRIRIVREEGHVRYVIERPPARRWFDAMDGAFD
ncbi:F-box domain-containing protein [Mycena kentingensis (nom. inval.)]|nr:F-box domain-containing protein [Mycena kentingensis (nom. inval.)]